jgi:cellulose biosynthesis protein BcsQ
MAKIVSFMNRKGGVGKSTLCGLLATSIYRRKKYKILVIDADEQLSVYKKRLKEDGESYEIVPFKWEQTDKKDNPVERFSKLISEVEEKFDVILIDTQGKLEGLGTPSVIMVSDVIIVPLVGSEIDLESTVSFLDTIPPLAAKKKAQGYDLKLFGVINKNDGSLEYKELFEFDGYCGLKLFKNDISSLVRYKRFPSTVKDLVPAKKQTDEYNIFYKEFLFKCGL